MWTLLTYSIYKLATAYIHIWKWWLNTDSISIWSITREAFSTSFEYNIKIWTCTRNLFTGSSIRPKIKSLWTFYAYSIFKTITARICSCFNTNTYCIQFISCETVFTYFYLLVELGTGWRNLLTSSSPIKIVSNWTFLTYTICKLATSKISNTWNSFNTFKLII